MQMKKRLLSILLSLCMVLGLLPAAAFATEPDDAALMDNTQSADKAIMIGTSGISDPEAIEVAGSGTYYQPSDYIYFGYNDNPDCGVPIKWRVLDADKVSNGVDDGMFLLSEYSLDAAEFNEDTTKKHEYQGSTAQDWCESFVTQKNNFSLKEQNAMLGIAKQASTDDNLYSLSWETSSLTENDKLFLLSAKELSDYVGNYQKASGLAALYQDDSDGDWWLRSHYVDENYSGTDSYAIAINNEGNFGSFSVDKYKYFRPAFNLDSSSVLFISKAEGGKSASMLTAVGTNDTNEWKLTLLDNTREFSVSTSAVSSTTAGGSVSVSYANAEVSNENTGEYVSAMLVDNQNNVLYYGRLQAVTSGTSSGTLDISIPAGLSVGEYTLKLFNEQYNGDKKTDYSSNFCDVKLTISEPAAYDENKTYNFGDVFAFGSYPQSKVTDQDLISALKNAEINTEWIDYNYYASASKNLDNGRMQVVENMMQYQDITCEGKKYRAVKINNYRPFWTGYTSSETYSFQDDHGYKTGNTYYFQYQPLLWKVLDPSNGYMMCIQAIDSQAYNNYNIYDGSEYYNSAICSNYSTDWEGSSLRTWLNNDFYNTAFTDDEKAKIGKSHLNNESTHDVGNKYDSKDTDDNIFILSFYDATNSKYGFSSKRDTVDQARQFQGTDYAKCQGLCTEGENVWWYLRTAATSKLITGVRYDGDASYGGSSYETYSTVKGIIPALKFNPEYPISLSYELDGGKWADDSYSAPTSYLSNEDPTLPTSDKLIKDGYTFSGWTLIEDKETSKTSKTYKATWTSTRKSSGGSSASSKTYTITVEDSENGSVSADQKSASSDKTVTLTALPDKGWTLETLTVLDKNGEEVELGAVTLGEKYIFKMPSSDITVKATFIEDNTILNYFVDVNSSDYFYDSVLWAANKGITSGTDDSHFSPSLPCTRAQIVTFLWRAADSPEPNSLSDFSDVAADSYYAKAVAWAIEKGITNGTTKTTFSPDDTCTRAQAVTFLYRASGSPAVSSGNITEFSDVADGAYYANAVKWAATEGVTEGTGSDTFSPDNDCTRAQIVTFLWRAMAE